MSVKVEPTFSRERSHDRPVVKPASFDRSTGSRTTKLFTLICMVLFAACLARYWVSYTPSASVPEQPETFHIARNIFERGQFANPFAALDTGPSAHLAPAFPAFLALLMRLAGEKAAGMYAVNLAAALVLCLQVALFPVFSEVLGMGRLNGVLAAAIWIAAKPRFIFGFEEFYASLLVAVACCIYRKVLDLPPQRASKLMWLLGGLMGLSLLTIPTAGLEFAAWICWEFWRRKVFFLKQELLPLILLPALIAVPWTVRNYFALHHFIPVRDDFGLELSVSNNDCAQFGIQKNIDSGCFDSHHPNHDLDEARKVLALGEPEYNRLRLREALSWITGHPKKFIKLSAMRFLAFWMPTETATFHHYTSGRHSERIPIYLTTVLSGLGLIILYRKDPKSALVCMSCLAFFPLIYYFVQFEYRYRYPILWVTFLLGSLPIAAVITWCWEALPRYLQRPAPSNAA